MDISEPIGIQGLCEHKYWELNKCSVPERVIREAEDKGRRGRQARKERETITLLQLDTFQN